ncbi:MAG: hypothetical protein DRP84_06255 [Spirochaetes bacterium]|nr:MAG: hypothetical protein DRP84_06255 [Spirochaetota bacterium]
MSGYAYFLGIDMGTTGIRCLLSDEKGNIVLSSEEDIHESFVASSDEKVSEQNPSVWKKSLNSALDTVLSRINNYKLMAITVDSTSGTILPIDRNYEPIFNALMHNDMRAYKESEFINSELGLSTKPSFALPKILWFKNNRPDIFERAYKFVHAADYLVGLISGEYGVSDFSNSVKTCYDLYNMKWPDEIESKLGIPLDKLPKIVKTGKVIAELDEDIRKKYGIKKSVKIVAGATDSTTGFYSSGAKDIGDWNTTLGTVLGLRGIFDRFIPDKEGLLYTHRHADGYWLPGGASNTGGEVLRLFFGNSVKEYDEKISELPPTGGIIYPLARTGEKLPFFNMKAKGFIKLNSCKPDIFFKAILEGLSYVEKMIYKKIEGLGYRVNDTIYAVGGGAYSLPWLKIRANIMGKTMARAKIVETAFGSCIIAAGGTYYKNVTEAVNNMVNMDIKVEPEDSLTNKYRNGYEKFVKELKERDYI